MRAFVLTLVFIQAQGAHRDSEDAMANLLLAMNPAVRARNVQRALPVSMGNQFSGKDKFRARDGTIEDGKVITKNLAKFITKTPGVYKERFAKWSEKAANISLGVNSGLKDINAALYGVQGDKTREITPPKIATDWAKYLDGMLTQADRTFSGVRQGVDEIYVAISPGGKNSDIAMKIKDGTYRRPLKTVNFNYYPFGALLWNSKYVQDDDGTILVRGDYTEEEFQKLGWEVKESAEYKELKAKHLEEIGQGLEFRGGKIDTPSFAGWKALRDGVEGAAP